MEIQLDLLENKTAIDILNEKIRQIDESCHKVRRRMFANHSELSKLYLKLDEDHENLKRMYYTKFPGDIEKLEFKLENAG